MDRPGRLGVDVGGTFTDIVLVADEPVTTAKAPIWTSPARHCSMKYTRR